MNIEDDEDLLEPDADELEDTEPFPARNLGNLNARRMIERRLELRRLRELLEDPGFEDCLE